MSGTDGVTAAAAGTATDAAATTTTTAGGTTTTEQAAAQQQTAGTQPTVEQLQADVEKWKALSRQNEQKAKANRDADEAQRKLLADVAAKLGIPTGDGKVDPAAITAQLEAAQRETKARSTELAVLRAAGRLGADGDALLDSRQFMAQLDALEGTEAIESAIKLAVAQNPARYAAAAAQTGAAAATDGAPANGTATATGTASASSAGDFTGAAGGNRQWTQADVDAAKPEQVVKAMEQGLLKSLLAG